MKSFLSIFSGMKAIDWVLVVSFIALVAFAINLVFPPNGWMIGIVVALLLLYIAKRRRDRLSKDL